jgi:hypothetical protein
MKGVMMEPEDVMLTTIDNPWNPFTHYDEWYAFDTSHGYYTPALLARVTVSSNELSDYDQELAITRAINEIVSENLSGIHRKVSRDSYKEVSGV